MTRLIFQGFPDKLKIMLAKCVSNAFSLIFFEKMGFCSQGVALAPFTKEKSGLSAADIPEVGMMMFSMHIWAKLEKQPKIALVILQGQPMSFPYQHH